MDNQKHYPVVPGMELPHQVKVEVHKAEIDHLQQLADTAVSDVKSLAAENSILAEMNTALQLRLANPWRHLDDGLPELCREASAASPRFIVLATENGELAFAAVRPCQDGIAFCIDGDDYSEPRSSNLGYVRWMDIPPVIL